MRRRTRGRTCIREVPAIVGPGTFEAARVVSLLELVRVEVGYHGTPVSFPRRASPPSLPLTAFGGSDHGNFGGLEATPVPSHGRPFSVNLTLPPLGALYLKSAG